MIALDTARQLKQAGLKWMAARHDFFAIPESGLDEHVFVISDMTIAVEMYGDYPVVTFNGASEWALDYVTLREVVWLPREDQLRRAVEIRLFMQPEAGFTLLSTRSGYQLNVTTGGQQLTFTGENASEVYARALLYLLQEQQGSGPAKG